MRPRPASSPGNIRALRSRHAGSNSGSKSSTGDPPGLQHPEPMAGNAFASLAVLLAPPRPEGAASSRPQRASRHLAGACPYPGPHDRSPCCGSQDDPSWRHWQQSYPRWQREARAGSRGRFLKSLSGAEQRRWLSDPRSCSGLPRAHLWSWSP